MIEFIVDKNFLDTWQKNVNRKFQKEFDIAQTAIRAAWIRELYRQQESQGDGTWQPLKKHYAERKTREFENINKINVQYNTILKRSGRMLFLYTKGISFFNNSQRIGVLMPFPEGIHRIRAKVHQGTDRKSSPLPIRAFDVDRFHIIAFVEFTKAMRRATGNE